MASSTTNTSNSAARIDVLGAIKWYFEARAVSLSSAITLRTQITVDQQRQLRHGYSQYFVSLLSAIDSLKEDPAGTGFDDKLATGLATPSQPDGAANLAYLRELRNAIVHRNLDISARADFIEGVPLLHAPTVTNRNGTRTFASPLPYVLQLVVLCEKVIGPTIDKHLSSTGMFAPSKDSHEMRLGQIEEFLRSDTTIPDFVRQNFKEITGQLDFSQLDQAIVDDVRRQLKPLELPIPESVRQLIY